MTVNQNKNNWRKSKIQQSWQLCITHIKLVNLAHGDLIAAIQRHRAGTRRVSYLRRRQRRSSRGRDGQPRVGPPPGRAAPQPHVPVRRRLRHRVQHVARVPVDAAQRRREHKPGEAAAGGEAGRGHGGGRPQQQAPPRHETATTPHSSSDIVKTHN